MIYDSKFLKTLAEAVFGLECLAASSVFGGRAWNASRSNAALDTVKLKFIEGDNHCYELLQNSIESNQLNIFLFE